MESAIVGHNQLDWCPNHLNYHRLEKKRRSLDQHSCFQQTCFKNVQSLHLGTESISVLHIYFPLCSCLKINKKKLLLTIDVFFDSIQFACNMK